MALKALLNDAPAYAWDVAGTGDFICAECRDGMYYRRAQRRKDGVTVVAHFAHRPAPAGQQRTCALSHGESEEHENGKAAVRLAAPGYFWWLKNAVGDVEYRLEEDDIKRCADVLFVLHDQQRVVFEIQFTKIPRREIAQRTLDYHKMRCHVIWCFPEKRDDLYAFCLRHFYCAGKLSDDGTEIEFRGNINPFRYAPSLKYPFDDKYIPPKILPIPAPVYHFDLPARPVRTPDPVWTAPDVEEIKQTAYHTLIRPRETGPWANVPRDMRSIVRLYINSEQERDRERAIMFCEEYELDYEVMRKVILDTMIEESREIERKKYGEIVNRRRAG